MNPKTSKPLLRGVFHQEAFFVALGAGAMLIAKSTSLPSTVSAIIYTLGLLMLFGISAVYHRPHWEPKSRAMMKRFDHSAIFIFIAGSMTPIALLALPEADGQMLLKIIWSVTVIGVLQSVFWVKAPKWVTAILYVAAGWLVFPYVPQLRLSLSETQIALLIAGGVVYTVGAVFYAMKKPKLWI